MTHERQRYGQEERQKTHPIFQYTYSNTEQSTMYTLDKSTPVKEKTQQYSSGFHFKACSLSSMPYRPVREKK